MVLIDNHTHVISTDTVRYPTSPIGGRQSQWSQTRPVNIDGLVRALDDAEIDKAVVVQASTVYGHDNRYVVEAVRTHPDRFIGVYSIDAPAPDAVERIKYWQGQGLTGFRLFTTGTTMPGQADWLGHRDSYPAWAYAEEQGIPVCLQMTIQGLPVLRGLLERFPGVRVLLDHCARPDLSDGRPYRHAKDLFDMAGHPGVHLKLTHRALGAAQRGASTAADFLADLVAAYGANRIAWGSNFPAAEGTPADLLAQAREAASDLSAADQEMIFGGSTAAFYTPVTTVGGPRA
ncbi:amidohydrolase family protein [Streptomyces olivaceus]|uniref:amidohydrolase family protein n=1 Tax=Streptomyces olivaceus TaxID=47716 RepID=UPI0004C4B461|nr:amidohydrolase family protein [Streptomyces olivaceus]MBZ6084802.1 amidohydrolase [Streptomyces olivaceus]MBZ6101330.1 amidohydrolase [Streptomyces olivaceus]MBZ6282170.1 amidohydrolase [Streptomyces olivaceus]